MNTLSLSSGNLHSETSKQPYVEIELDDGIQ